MAKTLPCGAIGYRHSDFDPESLKEALRQTVCEQVCCCSIEGSVCVCLSLSISCLQLSRLLSSRFEMVPLPGSNGWDRVNGSDPLYDGMSRIFHAH